MDSYKEYFWKEGVPIGKGQVDISIAPLSYKIIADPYRKWISIEKYKEGNFLAVVYDSALFDFRWLKQPERALWEKIPVKNSPSEAFIKNHDDRIINRETYTFQKNRCIKALLHSPHGFPVGVQRIFYKECSDPVNGVALYDTEGLIVMCKTYTLDPESGEFDHVIEEEWNHEMPSLLIPTLIR